MKENILQALFATILGAIAAYLNVLLVPLIVMLVVMVIDYGTGMAQAYISHTLNSRIGVMGIIKKIGPVCRYRRDGWAFPFWGDAGSGADRSRPPANAPSHRESRRRETFGPPGGGWVRPPAPVGAIRGQGAESPGGSGALPECHPAGPGGLRVRQRCPWGFLLCAFSC